MTCAVTRLVTFSEGGGGTAAFFGTVQHYDASMQNTLLISRVPNKASTTVGCFHRSCDQSTPELLMPLPTSHQDLGC